MIIKEYFFMDEKIFAIKESFNQQNYRVYASSTQEAHQITPRV
jgi:hypothetical protein